MRLATAAVMAVARASVSLALAALDRATAEYHADAEADLFRVLDEPTRTRYGEFLANVFDLEHVVEARIACIEELPIAFVGPRLKTARLAADLLALGRTTEVHPVDVPAIDDVEHALAWFYVLQRNTLQHLRLYRALVPHLRTTLQIASRYLTAHAGDVYQRWHELGGYLDRVDRLAAVLDLAREAFR